MPIGTLRVQSFAARLSAPIADVTVVVTGSNFSWQLLTDSEGFAPDLAIEAPSRLFSLDENNTTILPYATCNLAAYKEGYRPIFIEQIQIFEGEVTLAPLELVTDEGEISPIDDAPVIIPVHALFAGDGGSAPAPLEDFTVDPRVLSEVVIPTNITVHLGAPAASARNVTVSFRDYIANVASSEVYPTWPEQSIRANIHCQISCALNRIYTEWYPSRGYNFNITNSTSYDQYYVEGRTIFATMQRITDEIFNTFIRKTGTTNPFYAAYCDGKAVTCSGLKQWGTVTLAEQGRSALQILQSYYGSNTEVASTQNIAGIPQSYPGTALREGSTGAAVSTLQRQLARIAKDYPGIGSVSVDGVFGPSLKASVQVFQRVFNLTADGIVGSATWYKISYIYVSVTDLAELTSEGENIPGAGGSVADGSWNGTALRVGSTGAAVQQVQFWLAYIAQFYDDLAAPSVDGIFGAGTQAAVVAFQRKFGLTADGVVGQITWNAIFDLYDQFESDLGIPNVYPGTAVRVGDRGNDVRQIQFWLRIAAGNYSALSPVTVDGVFGTGTQSAVVAFQRYFNLSADGIVGRITWEKLYEVYLDITNGLLAQNQRPGTFPGTLRIGSTGAGVRELQYYLFILAAYENSIPSVSIDGVFGAGTEAAVRAFQRFADLTADGVVGSLTWNALYQLASRLRSSGEVRTITRMEYPDTALMIGESGEAVHYYSLLLARIAYYFNSVQSFGQVWHYDYELSLSTKSFQALMQLPETGVVDETTWLYAETLSLTLLANAPDTTLEEGQEYPAYAAAEDSVGAHVHLIQQWLNQYSLAYYNPDFLEETGLFTGDEAARVASIQSSACLAPTGTVDRETWALLRACPKEGVF